MRLLHFGAVGGLTLALAAVSGVKADLIDIWDVGGETTSTAVESTGMSFDDSQPGDALDRAWEASFSTPSQFTNWRSGAAPFDGASSLSAMTFNDLWTLDAPSAGFQPNATTDSSSPVLNGPTVPIPASTALGFIGLATLVVLSRKS